MSPNTEKGKKKKKKKERSKGVHSSPFLVPIVTKGVPLANQATVLLLRAEIWVAHGLVIHQ